MIYGAESQTPRERRREANLGRIVSAATDLVVSGGFDALSMGRLAQALDYTPGALYRYFSSKDALISAMTTRVTREFAGVLRDAQERVPGEVPLQRVWSLLWAWRRLAEVEPQRFGMLSLLLADPRMLIQEEAAVGEAMGALGDALAPLIQSLEACATAGDLTAGNATHRAVAVFAAVHGLMQFRKQALRDPALFDLDLLVRVSVRTHLVGWGADSGRLDSDFAAIAALGDPIARAKGMK